VANESKEREAAIDRLYTLPLDEFTAARDDLARRLRRDGDRAAADEVKRLRKPSVAAWALNQVRHSHRRESDKLIEAGRRLREGQEALLAGAGREQVERAAADERRLVGELTRRAERNLADAGRPASAAVQEKLRATLHAVASDPEARAEFEAGRLVRDHEPSGLGPLAEASAPSTGTAGKRRKKPPATTPTALERKARRLEKRLERARARRRKLEEDSAEAGRRVREARREAARAATELERAEAAGGRAEQAAQAVSDLERELADTRAG
jgi:hypothetical protein